MLGGAHGFGELARRRAHERDIGPAPDAVRRPALSLLAAVDLDGRVRTRRARAVAPRAGRVLVDPAVREDSLSANTQRERERVAVRVLRERYPKRSLDVNVEFYTAVLLDALGLARGAFSPVFAVGRVAGWLAHVDEERERGRLIRPDVRYVGAVPAEEAA